MSKYYSEYGSEYCIFQYGFGLNAVKDRHRMTPMNECPAIIVAVVVGFSRTG